jgi:hypothetical protein
MTMVDYARAASDLKARINAKIKRRADLNAFFEALRASIRVQVEAANIELSAVKAPTIDLRQEGYEEPTIELALGNTICKIAQDRSVPSLTATIPGGSGEKTVTFVIQTEQSPVTAQRVSLAPALEEKLGPDAIAAAIVEELILGAS